MTSQESFNELIELGDSSRAEHAQRFFKTGEGEYGEGDKFLGIKVPILRQQVKKYKNIRLDEILVLLKSEFHEVRLFSLFMLVEKFAKGTPEDKTKIYELYLSNTKYINNWDLVDSSASYIVGAYLSDKDKKPLYKLAKSKNLWERRISIIATFYMIKQNEFYDALEISKILKNDKEDLIHKAVGWMLREIGKRNISVEKVFLEKYYKELPRTMLRYAIEKFPENERKMYLQGTI
ncbi:MAG: DNA alkylation repair protein [Desulfobacterales bacterium]|nr:DNA alkylation repair protein [Desulfobacterales bacterium]